MTDFRIRVIVDPARAKTGTKSVNRSLDRTAAKADKLRSSLALTFALLGGTAIFASSIRLLANYGQAMATVQAVAGATREEFEEFKEAVFWPHKEHTGDARQEAIQLAAMALRFLVDIKHGR